MARRKRQPSRRLSKMKRRMLKTRQTRPRLIKRKMRQTRRVTKKLPTKKLRRRTPMLKVRRRVRLKVQSKMPRQPRKWSKRWLNIRLVLLVLKQLLLLPLHASSRKMPRRRRRRRRKRRRRRRREVKWKRLSSALTRKSLRARDVAAIPTLRSPQLSRRSLSVLLRRPLAQ